MKVIELIKIKKSRKSQDAVPKKASKIKISNIPNGTRPDDSYISNAGDVLDNSRGDDSTPRGK